MQRDETKDAGSNARTSEENSHLAYYPNKQHNFKVPPVEAQKPTSATQAPQGYGKH